LQAVSQFTKYYEGDQMKEEEMYQICSAYVRRILLDCLNLGRRRH